MRRGIPEVILGAGKSPSEVVRLAVAMASKQGQGLISRMSEAHQAAVRDAAAKAGLEVVVITRLRALSARDLLRSPSRPGWAS